MPDVWDTFRHERTVLVVARTLTSTIRLLDAVRLFRDDPRVGFRYTVNDTTEFSGGVRELLRAAGVTSLVPWRHASTARDRVALSASENIDFDELRPHTIVLPHGLGFNKFVPTPGGRGTRLAGLPPERVLREGRATVVLSHPDQETQLRAATPAVVGRTAVTGDVLFDRLTASAHLRERYRARLGTGDRHLVLVASTWRDSSVIGRHTWLPGALLADLPMDRFQVCVALHPNVWARHGRDVHLIMAGAVEAGLVLLPPEHGWEAAMIAADQVITDHGSLGLFAAALDRPLLLTGDTAEIVPDTPVSALAATAPRLDPVAPLRPQVERSMASHAVGAYGAITGRVFGNLGNAARDTRALVYTHLGLAPPAHPTPHLRVTDPPPQSGHPHTHSVHVATGPDGSLTLTRYPTAAHPEHADLVVVSDEAEPNLALTERASALTTLIPKASPSDVESWARTALARWPGARTATARTASGTHVTVVRDGPTLSVETSLPTHALAVTCYHAALLGAPIRLPGLVHVGPESHAVGLSPG